MSWSKEFSDYVDGKANEVARAWREYDKDGLASVLYDVEEDTGYNAGFLYEVLSENEADYPIEVAAEHTITVAYERDY